MQLQEETHTTKFENEHQQAVVNVLFTYTWCIDQLKKVIMPYDITTQQFNILRILRGQYPSPSTINLLKSRMLDKMSDASRIVDRLVQKELALKNSSISDKRSVDILISRKGLALLKKMDAEVSISGVIAANLTEPEAAQLNILLDKMRG
jgi:DNA-binding MarR family transcriptional regulator